MIRFQGFRVSGLQGFRIAGLQGTVKISVAYIPARTSGGRVDCVPIFQG
jgi:hypothetical protein